MEINKLQRNMDVGKKASVSTNRQRLKATRGRSEIQAFKRRWEKNHIASMLHGAAGNLWEALKTNEDFLQHDATWNP